MALNVILSSNIFNKMYARRTSSIVFFTKYVLSKYITGDGIVRRRIVASKHNYLLVTGTCTLQIRATRFSTT